jgi:hypothetical protein
MHSRLEEGLAGAVVICKVWRLAIMLQLLIVLSGVYKWSINPFTDPHPSVMTPGIRSGWTGHCTGSLIVISLAYKDGTNG